MIFTVTICLSSVVFYSILWTTTLLTSILLQTSQKWFSFPHSLHIFLYDGHCWVSAKLVFLCLFDWWLIILLFWCFLFLIGFYSRFIWPYCSNSLFSLNLSNTTFWCLCASILLSHAKPCWLITELVSITDVNSYDFYYHATVH